MGVGVTLRGEGGTILIEPNINEYGWTRCELLATEKIYLGADTLQSVVSGLLKALSEGHPVPASGQIDGHEVFCALLLSEAHHALYYADCGAQRHLFWQNAYDAPMTLVGKITLSTEQCRQWRVQLEELLNYLPKNGARRATITKEIAEIVVGAEALK